MDTTNQDQLEKQWADGSHTTSKGQVILITEIITPQLVNTINKYSQLGYDTTVLQSELARRNSEGGNGN